MTCSTFYLYINGRLFEQTEKLPEDEIELLGGESSLFLYCRINRHDDGDEDDERKVCIDINMEMNVTFKLNNKFCLPNRMAKYCEVVVALERDVLRYISRGTFFGSLSFVIAIVP